MAPVVRSISSFDALGRVGGPVGGMSQQVGSNPVRTVTSIMYNFAGGMTQEVLPSGRLVSYGYDGAGRASSVTGVIKWQLDAVCGDEHESGKLGVFGGGGAAELVDGQWRE